MMAISFKTPIAVAPQMTFEVRVEGATIAVGRVVDTLGDSPVY